MAATFDLSVHIFPESLQGFGLILLDFLALAYLLQRLQLFTAPGSRVLQQALVREWLYWYDESGQRYPTPNERIQQEYQLVKEFEQRAQESEQRAKESERRAQQLAQKLRELGIDPDSLS